MIFKKGEVYDHHEVMQGLDFDSVEALKNWTKKHQICHFRVNGIWTYTGDVLVSFLSRASKHPDDWRRDRKEERLRLEGPDDEK